MLTAFLLRASENPKFELKRSPFVHLVHPKFIQVLTFREIFVHSAQAAEAATPPPFQPSEQFGATEPLGFFDPLGFTAVGDERGFRKLRVSEIKHGRVARLHFEPWKTSECRIFVNQISSTAQGGAGSFKS